MICIAESGSTKTDWVFIGDGSHRYKSEGLNPFFVSSIQTAEIVGNAIPTHLLNAVSEVFFYGAGCSSADRNQIIARGLQQKMPQAEIVVDHDLLAAARALLQQSSGVACILGTGSNSCYYNGKTIVENIPSLGYVLGDEGSGGSFGKSLVKAFIYKEMPKDLHDSFSSEFQLNKEEVLNRVYNQPQPNKFLASLAPFCGKHRDHEFIQRIIHENFDEFIVRHVLKYTLGSSDRIGFVGSIACTFERELRAVLTAHKLEAGSFLRKPIDPLVEYHLKSHAV